MLIYSIFFLLLSCAVILRRDKSILFNRTSILILLSSFLLGIFNFFIRSLYNGIGLFADIFPGNNYQINPKFYKLLIMLLSSFIAAIIGFTIRYYLKYNIYIFNSITAPCITLSFFTILKNNVLFSFLTISILTLVIVLLIFSPNERLSMANILALILYYF